MIKRKLLTIVLFCSAVAVWARAGRNTTVTVHGNQGVNRIYREIYGQFAEHLGTCIYGGLWVGPESPIPNTDGYRNDVLEALKDLKVPVLRWPGGCFADEYHWMDGIGPRAERPKMQNNNWGGTIEDNSFGTHEFLNLCEMLGAEPYISGNVGSGTVEELSKWVEYMTSAGDTPMAKLRRQNGRDKPWRLTFLGVGNESWGCGGNMRPEYYADLFRRYSVYCRDYDGAHLYKIASGASDYDYNWTKVLMRNVGTRMSGCSLHYYTVTGWNGSKGSATHFSPEDFYWTISKAVEIEEVIEKHDSIMTEKDPRKKIGLLVDEWGTWWDEEPGGVKGHLYQQNTLREAFVAAMTLNIFQRHTDRVRMANIAQIVNVLQSMILTDTKDGGHIALTPTYHVFEMYKGFQDGIYLPTDVDGDEFSVSAEYTFNGTRQPKDGKRRTGPYISASAAEKAGGGYIISLVNANLDEDADITLNLEGMTFKTATARILTSKNISDFNTFEKPDRVKPAAFSVPKGFKNVSSLKIPAKSIVVIEME